MIFFFQNGIGVVDHLDIDGQTALFGHVRDMAFETAGVGNRGIDPEDGFADMMFLQFPDDAVDRFIGRINDGIGAGKSAEVTVTAVHSLQDHTAAESSFHQDDCVERVDMYGAAFFQYGKLLFLSNANCFFRGTHAHQSGSLPFGQPVPVSDECDDGPERIAAVQQIADVFCAGGKKR